MGKVPPDFQIGKEADEAQTNSHPPVILSERSKSHHCHSGAHSPTVILSEVPPPTVILSGAPLRVVEESLCKIKLTF